MGPLAIKADIGERGYVTFILEDRDLVFNEKTLYYTNYRASYEQGYCLFWRLLWILVVVRLLNAD